MTTATPEAITGLLDAIRNYHGPRADIGLACAAVCGQGLDATAVAEFTRYLGGNTRGHAAGAACLSCGATQDLDTVHRAATVGVAARTEWYCHDATGCHHRRHAHLTATSAVA